MKTLYSLVIILLFSCNGKESSVSTTSLKSTDTNLKWVDYHEGELPPVGYYDAFDSIIKKWNIRYERIDGGCEVVPGEKKKYEKNNQKYFQILEKQFGKDWRQRFDKEVNQLDSILDKNNASGYQ